MLQSGQRRKQRKFRFTAEAHIRQKFAHSHVSKELAQKLGIKRRSVQIHKGDTVKVMSGAQRGKSGKVSEVDTHRSAVYIDGITRKSAKGKEKMIAIRASNVYITEMDLADAYRKAKLGVK